METDNEKWEWIDILDFVLRGLVFVFWMFVIVLRQKHEPWVEKAMFYSSIFAIVHISYFLMRVPSEKINKNEEEKAGFLSKKIDDILLGTGLFIVSIV